MRDVLGASLDSGTDLGASVAVTLDGEMVVDLWGGWANTEKTAPWVEDTITNVWSTTKTMTALAALVLVAQGELDVYAPVAKYWPEFGSNGKESIEVRHLLSHTSGVSAWEQPITIEDVYDWDKSTALLARQAPWWTPGTASGYHMLNQGHLVGEVINRITGQTLGPFFRDHVAAPLGADFHIGLDPKDDHRVSNVVPPPPIERPNTPIDPNSPAMKTYLGPPLPPIEVVWSEPWRRAQIGAANGHGNARSVALLQALVACEGEVGGVRLLDAKTCALIFDQQSDGVDLVIAMPLRFGIGYGLADDNNFSYLPKGRICHWGGYGGSAIIIDLDRRMTIAYMMNRMEAVALGDPRAKALIGAAYDALNVAR
jgi:CubicO group peptidase (beta-lactamase class C family)